MTKPVETSLQLLVGTQQPLRSQNLLLAEWPVNISACHLCAAHLTPSEMLSHPYPIVPCLCLANSCHLASDYVTDTPCWSEKHSGALTSLPNSRAQCPNADKLISAVVKGFIPLRLTFLQVKAISYAKMAVKQLPTYDCQPKDLAITCMFHPNDWTDDEKIEHWPSSGKGITE